MARKYAFKRSQKAYHNHMKEVLVPLLVQRFSKKDLAAFMVEAVANNRTFDDIYGELINWASTHYEERK